LIVKALDQEKNYRLIVADNVTEARNHLSQKPDIVLLDLMLPDGSGLSLIHDIHEKTDAQIIIISSKDKLTDKIVGLEMGADDYITKPFQMDELLARVNARGRQQKTIKTYREQIDRIHPSQGNDPVKIKFGDWILDRSQWQAYDSSGQSANLTPREFYILETLVLEGNKVLSRAQLLDRAWQEGNNTTDRAVDIQILRIRKKIGDTAEEESIIKSVRGIGYQLVSKVERLQ
jgi:DNA-binding response OmpR family regulator